jgi:integrase
MERQVLRICEATVTTADGTTVQLGALPAMAIGKPHIEAFRLQRRLAHERFKAAIQEVADLRAGGKDIPDELLTFARPASMSIKSGRVATNRLLTRLRHMYSWAIEQELLDCSPFEKGGVTVVKLDGKAEGGRSRRLEGDEEDRLQRHAGAHLRACITAILESGMRKGEILGLQWQHVRSSLGEIHLPESVTKTGVSRVVLITPRLAAVLEMLASSQRVARELEDNADLPVDGHPFGNEIGERVKGFQSAWRLTCRRAGIQGLRFHHLRRESGSRLLETPGVNVADVRDYLGHRDVGQTNKYLASTTARLRDALTKRDAARTSLAQPPVLQNEDKPETAVTH